MKALSLEEDIAKEKMSFANEEIERIGKMNEKKSASLEELNAELESLKVSLAESNKEAIEQKEVIENSKSSLFKQREEIASQLEQKILSFYEKIRLWAGNSAVVPVRKQACYGCYMKISDKFYADVIKSEEITTCPHCGRILYIEREKDEN
jgi:predicted  nucleic acid-binding Zn-ribbon protein